MASSRSHKAKASPALAPQPSRRQGTGAKLLAFLKEKPLETLGLGALGTALGTAVGALGFVTLRARESLLGLSPGLFYPKQEWLLTGFDALASLLWRGLSVLVSDHPVLRWSAWALLLLLLGLVLAARARRRPALLLVALGASALLLVVGSSFYRVALAATSPQDAGPSQGFHCGKRLSANLADQAAFETCSWLVNDTPRNDGRRSDLAGLLGWLVAACLTAVLAGALASMKGRRLSGIRWVLVGAHVLLGLLLLSDLPRAYAFAQWGLRYPQVVGIQKDCDKTLETLAQALARKSCWAFDVSANAEKRVIFVQGAGCPEGQDGSFVPIKNGECLITLTSQPRVIVHE